MKNPWLMLAVAALVFAGSSFACWCSLDSVNESSAKAEVHLNDVVHDPKSSAQDVEIARVRFSAMARIQRVQQLIWFFGAYFGLFLSLVALVGRGLPWYSKPILPVFGLYSSIAAVITTMPVVLFYVSLQLFGPMH